MTRNWCVSFANFESLLFSLWFYGSTWAARFSSSLTVLLIFLRYDCTGHELHVWEQELAWTKCFRNTCHIQDWTSSGTRAVGSPSEQEKCQIQDWRRLLTCIMQMVVCTTGLKWMMCKSMNVSNGQCKIHLHLRDKAGERTWWGPECTLRWIWFLLIQSFDSAKWICTTIWTMRCAQP
jgi:hypothetical protein